MTNSSLSYALKCVAAGVCAIALAGCGSSDQASTDGVLEEAMSDTNSVAYIQSEAQAALVSKDWAAAIRAYNRLAFDETLPAEVQSIGWTGRGLVDYSRLADPNAPGELADTARAAFMHAVRLDRRNPAALYHLGMLYRDNYAFFQAALEQFEKYAVVMKGSDDPHVAMVEGWISKLKAEIAARHAELPGADRRNPSACAAALKRGDALFAKKLYTKARFAYDSALKEDPLCYDAAVRLAECWEKTDRTKYGRQQALKAYNHASSLRTYASTLLAGAALAEKLDSRAVATSLYSKAVAASPTNMAAIDGLVRTLKKNGENQAAQAYIRYRNSIPRK